MPRGIFNWNFSDIENFLKGRNISFQTHQSDPSSGNAFYKELTEKLDQIKNSCLEETIDVVVAGGSVAHPVRERAYKQTISLINQTVNDQLGFEPHIVMEPKINTREIPEESVCFDTQNRILYVVR